MTAPRTLTLAIVSPMCVGVTGLDPLGPDRDVPVDAHGLPYVPRGRMSARLRDAALAVVQAFPGDVGPATELLGAARGLGVRRSLVVGPAMLPEAVRATVAAASGEYGVAPTALTRACTVELASTRIDEHGAAAAGTLRTVRALAPGQILQARLRWTRPPEPSHLRVLARCCLALVQIGSGDTRGLGRVRCTLDGDTATTLTLAGFGDGAAVDDQGGVA